MAAKRHAIFRGLGTGLVCLAAAAFPASLRAQGRGAVVLSTPGRPTLPGQSSSVYQGLQRYSYGLGGQQGYLPPPRGRWRDRWGWGPRAL